MDSAAKSSTNQLKLLDGIVVLDLTSVLSGPLCTYQLTLLGARVIKIENPDGGDLARQLGGCSELNRKSMGASFLAQNAGKESVCLNLKAAEGVELFKRLSAQADVVVENFRPGVMDRLGIGYEVLSLLNPGIILCSISGFGRQGPMSANPAYDQIVQGLSGVMSVTGDSSKQSSPMRAGFPVCDSIGGLTAAFAIASALFSRHTTGIGQALDVSMLDSTLVSLGWVVSNFLSADIEPTAIGNENMTAAPSGAFATADRVLNIAANKQDQFERLCSAIGRPDLVIDERFKDREDRRRHRQSLNDEITTALQTNTADHWERLLNLAGVPAGRVLSVPEILAHEQIQNRDFIQTLETDLFHDRPLRVTRAGFRSQQGLPGVDRLPPVLGQDTARVLRDLGISVDKIEELVRHSVVYIG